MLNLDGSDPLAEAAYCHHRHHLDEHSQDFDTCPHFVCVGAREARARLGEIAEKDVVIVCPQTALSSKR